MIDEIEKRIEGAPAAAHSVDGEPGSGWVLMDYGDVLVHIFNPGTRDYYQLEELWNNAPTIVAFNNHKKEPRLNTRDGVPYFHSTYSLIQRSSSRSYGCSSAA